MANSLRSKLSKLRHDRHISEEEYQAFIKKLDGHDKQIRAEAIDEYVKTFCDKDNQAGFLVLSKHTHSWNAYAKYVADQLKEQNK